MHKNDSYLQQEESKPLFAVGRRVQHLVAGGNLNTAEQVASYLITSSSFQELIKQLELNPSELDANLLLQVFVHTSFHHEFSSKVSNLEHNEQLEFLGDSVIALIITTLIYQRYPDLSEGDMSKLRSSLVNKEALGMLGEFLKMDRLVLVGRGEIKNWCHKQEQKPTSILANTFEALVGVLYLELGHSRTLEIIKQVIEDYSTAIGTPFISKERLEEFDPKSRLQEITMALYQKLPTYRDHWTGNKFIVSLNIGDRLIGEVSGPSKREAKHKLSLMALKQLKGEGAIPSC